MGSVRYRDGFQGFCLLLSNRSCYAYIDFVGVGGIKSGWGVDRPIILLGNPSFRETGSSERLRASDYRAEKCFLFN